MAKWTKEDLETLKRLWDEGVMSAAMIAVELKRSRNSVIGRANRLRLEHRQPQLRIPSRMLLDPKVKLRIRKQKPKQLKLVAERPKPKPSAEGVRLLDLMGYHCRWPRDADKSRYCGMVKEKGSYCAEHAKRAYQSLTRPPTWQRRLTWRR